MILGTLPWGDAAHDFELDDDTNLSMMMDAGAPTRTSSQGIRGWPIILAGTAREVLFDNDPGVAVVPQPELSSPHDSLDDTDCSDDHN